MTLDIVIIIVTLILSAFFSGMEIAYVSSNKIHIELEKKQEDFLGRILTKLTAKPSKYIATMLIGNNIALVIYGLKMGDVLVRWFQSMLPSDSTVLTYLFHDFNTNCNFNLCDINYSRVFAKSIFSNLRQYLNEGFGFANLYFLCVF